MKIMSYGRELDLMFLRGEYASNDTLAIRIMSKEDGEDYYEPYCMLTVNLPDYSPLASNCAFIDSNNCPADVVTKLIEEQVLTMTTLSAQSGFCTYPLAKFNVDWLDSLRRI